MTASVSRVQCGHGHPPDLRVAVADHPPLLLPDDPATRGMLAWLLRGRDVDDPDGILDDPREATP